jgi:hypothetical protein
MQYAMPAEFSPLARATWVMAMYTCRAVYAPIVNAQTEHRAYRDLALV